MLNTTVVGSEHLCPGLTDWENKFIAYLGYYVEGVLILVTSIIGITINLVSSIIILTRSEMRNCFNILLVALAGYDTWYLIGAILEACRKYFPALRSDNAIYLFPYFLYPAHQTSIAGSIFMTVAIAFERYAAVHYPLDYNQVSLLKTLIYPLGLKTACTKSAKINYPQNYFWQDQLIGIIEI